MNFKSLKAMVNTLVKTYSCNECNSKTDDANIDIIWAAWTTINIDIICSWCWKHSMIKSEIIQLDVSKAFSKDSLKKLKKTLIKKENNSSIKDKQIVDLNSWLKKNKLSVSDLFNNKDN